MSSRRSTTRSSILSQIFSPGGLFMAFAVVVGLAMLALTSLTTVNGDARKAYEKDRARDEAAGESYDMLKLLAPVVPDDQNFAMTPLLAPLLNYTRDETGVHWPQSEHDDKVPPRLGLSFTNGGSMRPPDTGNWEVQTSIDLAAWQSYYRATNVFSLPEKPGTPAQDVLAALAKYAPVIDELRAASRRPSAYFPIHPHVHENFAMLLPHLASDKNATLFLRLHALAALEDAQPDLALDDLRVAFRLIETVAREPLLVSQSLCFAQIGQLEQPIWEGLARGRWKKEHLETLQKLLEPMDGFRGVALGLRGERAAANDAILQMITKPALRDGVMDATEDPFGMGKSFRFVPSFALYRNLIGLNDYYRTNITLVAGLDRRPGTVVNHLQEFEHMLERKTAKKRLDNILLSMLAPSLTDIVRKAYRSQATVALTATACALERCRLETGAYPPALSALTPKYLAKIPLDPMDLKPLRYQLATDGSYRLYSIGLDGEDQGGVPVPNPKGTALINDQGDLVWTLKPKDRG